MTEQRKSNATIPEEFSGLIEDFRDLLEKYPRAARHFSLAYHPAGRGEESGGTLTVGIPQPIFECSEIEPGFVVCDRVDEQ
ncbi:hypothetical protein OG906_35770 (plasmid) [Streptomyces sp. NBC_01426]|uniref:hypothetical protein n=1 Tax=unclassified Streptomyces TaxID=2593676 RepID=UPI002E2FF896|nr:hypothetical protein [Streptomyces sp. NBC_01426]